MKSKKIISLILAIALVFTATILVVTATAKSATVVITAEKSELKSGETTTISVSVNTNFPVATMSSPVFYDKELVTVSDATATLSDYSVKSAILDSQSADTSKVYANTAISEDEYGFVLVNYIGGAGTSVPETLDSVVLTFNVTANSDVEGEAIVKCVAESGKTTENAAGMLYFGSPTSGNAIDSIPENIENIEISEATETITIVKATAEPNTLVLNENAPFEAVIDTVNCGDFTGAVYGFDTLGWNDEFVVDGTIADFVTTAYGDDYLEVISADGGETTGTVINVLDENGDVVESYVYIYFGDIDMDGLVGSSDAGIAEYYEMMYEGVNTLYQFMAGDLDGDGMPGSSDAGIMEYWEMNYMGMPTQADTGLVAYEIAYEIF